MLIAVSLVASACHSDQQTQSQAQPGSQQPEIDAQEPNAPSLINPAQWPLQNPAVSRDSESESRINELLSRMSLEEKVGQIIQGDINTVTPEKVRELHLGSVLNGGNSAPDGNLRNTPDSWLALADDFWEASTDTSDGGLGIPVIWGTDAVHGSSNVVGSTIFPHNIGLGAANDPDLMYEIGRATALEILAVGLDWTFAPTTAVVRNDRWGRTYEGFSEDPEIVAAYAPRIVEGIQGVYGTDNFLDDDHLLATAKHFTGDGGTANGIDQGDNLSTEQQLRDIHSAGYPPAIAAGVQSVMASYNSFHGKKMHGLKPMLTDVLVGRMGFDGFVVGDWNGHGQVEGCTNESCAASFNAGLDMFMAPDDWEALYHNTLQQVQTGEIPMERLDQAVARILRVKIRAGTLDAPKPSARKHAGDWALLGAAEHRKIAREAVRKSLVLLKNENGILPLAPNSNVIVAGNGAHNIGKQCGGWTLSWQGTGNSNEHFPNATSIYEGIAEAVEAAGGTAVLSENGEFAQDFDAAIVVFGEEPYAEGLGDRTSVDYIPHDGLKLLRKFKEAGIPTVSVFISGRPMWINPEMNASDAFIAAWLPGSEGVGIADVMFTNPEDETQFDFTGRLSFSWPARADQVEVNVGDADYNPLFAYGYGLSLSDEVSVALLDEDAGDPTEASERASHIIELGNPTDHWQMSLKDADGQVTVHNVTGSSPGGALKASPADHNFQEDTFIANWHGAASLVISGESVNFQQLAGENLALEISYQVLRKANGSTTVALGGGVLDLTDYFANKAGSGWQTLQISLSCFAARGARLDSVTEPLVISAVENFSIQIDDVKLVDNPESTDCP